MSAFTFNRNYRDNEQVRPYFADYCAVRAELIPSGRGSEWICYNIDFKGRIASLVGTDDKNEDTAIYLLQNMYTLDAEKEREAAFIADGGREVTHAEVTEGTVIRGTIVHRGFYMGGTGWQQWDSARLISTHGGRSLVVLPKGKRTNGHLIHGRVLVKEARA